MNKLQEIQEIIEVKFNDIKILQKSLTHKSFDNLINNEKLEFLGDRVLGLILSEKLINIYPNEKEGIIDKKFSNLVNKRTCAAIAVKINLKKYMFLGSSNKDLKRSDQKILSDGLEALIGAIYLDNGLEKSKKFILNFWKEYLDKSEITIIDPKTRLQEYSLKKHKKLPKYKLSSQTGPHHSPKFKAEVQIFNSRKYTATGSSKKNAQQNAAKKLLIELKL